MAQSQHTIGPEELSKLLEPIIRRVVREELDRIIGMNPNIFHLQEDMPLHEDMQDILERKAKNQIKLHSHKEVWD